MIQCRISGGLACKKGTDHPKATGVYVTIVVFERFWVVSPFFTPVLFFIIYPVRQLL